MFLASGVGTRLFHTWLHSVTFKKYRFSQKWLHFFV